MGKCALDIFIHNLIKYSKPTEDNEAARVHTDSTLEKGVDP
jgi:hypothetical protein